MTQLHSESLLYLRGMCTVPPQVFSLCHAHYTPCTGIYVCIYSLSPSTSGSVKLRVTGIMQRAQIHQVFVGLCLIAVLACLGISNSYTTKPSNQHVFMTQICQSEGTQNISILDLKQKLQVLPIRCFPGSEGLFPKKYDKLLLSLAEYAVLHCKTSNVRKLIWKCGPGDLCGGLVDRLRGIAFTLLHACCTQ